MEQVMIALLSLLWGGLILAILFSPFLIILLPLWFVLDGFLEAAAAERRLARTARAPEPEPDRPIHPS